MIKVEHHQRGTDGPRVPPDTTPPRTQYHLGKIPTGEA